MSRRPAPIEPRNVRLVLPDGTIVPLELTYVGVRKHLYTWRAVHRTLSLGDVAGARLLADVRPAYTAILLDVEIMEGSGR